MFVKACQVSQGSFRRKPTPCSSHPLPALVCIPTGRNRRNHARLSDICETRRSFHTSSILVHAGQLVGELGTDPPRQRGPAEDMTNPSCSLLVQRDTLVSALAGT